MEEIDRTTIKALSAETRLRILKLLSEHRATGADISRLLGLSPSTVNEHLKKLEAAGLILRRETGHKWVYYEPSRKGGTLVARPSLQFVVVLAIGILVFLGGAFLAIIVQRGLPAPPGASESAATTTTTTIAQESAGVVADAVTQPSLLPIVAMLVGVVIMIVMVSSYYKNKQVTSGTPGLLMASLPPDWRRPPR